LALYPQKLASLDLDLALAPLEVNLFNDCKSNLRLLEYGACGFPVICTDTKAYQGYLPCTRVISNSTGEWIDAIRMHLADPAASYRQGDALREAVMRDYVLTEHNLQHWANAWLAD
ncbi:MAG: glycosyltransferase, partial [Pseudomonas sp.]